MREHHIKALPVIDQSQRVVGILTVADFMRHAGLDQHEGVAERLLALVKRDAKASPGMPDTVGRIMTRGVRVISGDRRVAELVPLFSEAGHHHIPVIDEHKRIVGIITTGKGVTIHTIDCATLESFSEAPERWIDVGWDSANDGDGGVYTGRLKVTVANQPGSLSSLSTVIARHQGNISNLRIVNRSMDFFDMVIELEVS